MSSCYPKPVPTATSVPMLRSSRCKHGSSKPNKTGQLDIPLQLQTVKTQLLGFTFSTAALLLRHPATLRQASLTHAAVSELLPQFTHLQQKKLSQTLRTFLIWGERQVEEVKEEEGGGWLR